jgi:hypothetical protein
MMNSKHVHILLNVNRKYQATFWTYINPHRPNRIIKTFTQDTKRVIAKEDEHRPNICNSIYLWYRGWIEVHETLHRPQALKTILFYESENRFYWAG